MSTTTDDQVIDLTEDQRPDERGRDADRPGDIPTQGWKDVLVRVKDQLKADQVPLLSAGVAFYVLLALFPAIAALVSVYGLVADPAQVQQQVANVTDALPQSAQQLVVDQLQSVVSGAGQGVGITLVLGLLASLWAASSGMKHLVEAVNAAYDEPETRGFLKLRGLALALTVGGIVFGVVAIGLIAVLPVALRGLSLGGTGQLVARIVAFVLLAGGFGTALAVLYHYAPDRDRPRWRWVSWGAVIATVVWIVASVAFSFYVSNFGSYGETYGSIGAVVVLMLWLAITAFAVILGAEIDSEMEAQTARDSTVGAAEPMGERGARKADRLGARAD